MHGHNYSHTRTSSKVDGEVGVVLELGETLLPALNHEKNCTLQWGFICRVYLILSIQILIAAIVSSVTVLYAPIHNYFLRGKSGLLFFLICLPFILLWPLYVYHQKHPHNLVFLGLFTASVSFIVGFNCANTEGGIVLRALILTAAVVCSLTGYTFWASKKGKHFSYLQPFLFTSLSVLMLIGFVQMFFPVCPVSYAIFGAMGAVIFSGYLVYDTDNMIKGFHGDQ